MKTRNMIVANALVARNDVSRAIRDLSDQVQRGNAKGAISLLKELKGRIVSEKGQQVYDEVERLLKAGKPVPREVYGKFSSGGSAGRIPTKMQGELLSARKVAQNAGTENLHILLSTADSDIDDGDIEEAKDILRETRSRALRSGYTREWMEVAKRGGMNSVAVNDEHPLVQECYERWNKIVWDCINFLEKQYTRPRKELLDTANNLYAATKDQYGNKRVLTLQSAIAKAIDVLKHEAARP